MPEKLALLFPGQGQIPRSLPPHSPASEALYSQAESAGLDIRTWIRAGDHAQLARTEVAQPTVFLDSIARLEALRARGVAPDAVAGHSLGEYSSLVAAGVLEPDAALGLVLLRGKLMADVRGGMTAILKLDLAAVEGICRAVGGGAVVANYNGSQQFVVSAPLDALEDLARRAAELGGRAVRLDVSGPFHSPAMLPAERALAPAIRGLRFAAPRVSFVSSSAGASQVDAHAIQDALARQMTSPVRWTAALTTLADLGVTEAIEMGEGTVLTQLGRRAEPRIRFHTYAEVSDA